MGGSDLGQRQIFLMKKENLAKRVQNFYETNKNSEHLIQYMVAILVRNALSQGTFTEQLKDLIREVYLTTEPNDTMRQYSPFFKTCFNGGEWKTIIKKLFKKESNYYAATEEARFYNNYLEKQGTLDNRREGLVYHVESIFEDASGKKHKLTIRDTDPTKDEELTANILRTLTTLTIFENTGVRKFVELISYKTPGVVIATAYNCRKEEKAAAQASLDEKDSIEASPKVSQRKIIEKQAVQNGPAKSGAGQTLLAERDPDKKQNAEITPVNEGLPETPLTECVASPTSQDTKRTRNKSTSSSKDDLSDNRNLPKPQSIKGDSKKKSTNAAALIQKPDTAYKRIGKTAEQIAKGREDKRIKREVDRLNGKKKKKKKKK